MDLDNDGVVDGALQVVDGVTGGGGSGGNMFGVGNGLGLGKIK